MPKHLAIGDRVWCDFSSNMSYGRKPWLGRAFKGTITGEGYGPGQWRVQADKGGKPQIINERFLSRISSEDDEELPDDEWR